MPNIVLGLVFMVFCGASLTAAPQSQSRNKGNYYVDENAIAIKEMRESIESIRHEVNNHETEIRMYDEKLTNFDAIIESVRDQLSDANKAHKEQLKGNSSTLEEKISTLDSTTKGLVADLRQFKTHANDATTALGQYKQKISELEKILEIQNQNIEHLQAALRSVMDAMEVKETAMAKASADPVVSASGNTYRIKSGDSLEKIARSNNTTIQILKELNSMTSDKIVVGKVIKLP